MTMDLKSSSLSMNTRLDNGNACGNDDNDGCFLDEKHLPWGHVANFLSLQDILSLRLSSQSIAMQLHENLCVATCSFWLEHELLRRKVYLWKDIHRWMDAKQTLRYNNDDNDVDNDKDCLLSWRNSSDTTTSTSCE